ncbi:2-amino-4-hydroxy-6-hydroxymethyldihydropteridine diphosphokinase [Blattabacterium cuenoti]|uniref:2-amino-4-hydroxy-6- hydroxymethyldihydropteridine diphosphokinase n=1 Tax=Blattabacterium cuenoti TaxID=1653831 RepID=UPI00163CB0B4|nr:2-amino-4-hydroxy-6-hydroxymethyldihydropteridine diphosphokinase [Blattabacterium cuenoti]
MKEHKEHDVFLLQGSNKENKKKYLDKSLILISKNIGKIVDFSSYFESEAWNMKNYSIFYNRALHIKTYYSPIDLLKNILNIEFIMGRRKKYFEEEQYQNREIDIDILFYDHVIIYSCILTIPHPLLHLRRFVLEPMCEIAPKKNHPIFNLTILEMLGLCMDKLYVQKIFK